jgi:hypothetical protein
MRKLAIVALAALASIVVGVWVSASGGDEPARVNDAVFERAPGSATRSHHSVSVDGGQWAMKSYKGKLGHKCVSQTVPGEGESTSCIEPSKMFADGREVLVFPGGRQKPGNSDRTSWHNLWLYGYASGRVASLQLVNVDCSVQTLALDGEHAFEHVVSRSDIEHGASPYKVVARDQGGAVIYERDVRISAPASAKAPGIPEPTPQADCA